MNNTFSETDFVLPHSEIYIMFSHSFAEFISTAINLAVVIHAALVFCWRMEINI